MTLLPNPWVMSEHLSIATPADLLHAVPFLLGFHPSASIVISSVREGEERRIGLTARVDYPDDPADGTAIAERMVDHLVDDGAVGALVVIYRQCSLDETTSDPVFDSLRSALAEFELVIHDALLVDAGRWRSLLQPEAGVHVIPDFASSAVAAEHVLHGAPLPHASEAALRATLQAHGSDVAQQIAGACASRRDVVNRETILEGDGQRMRAVRRRHIQQAADAIDRVFEQWLATQNLATMDMDDLALLLIGMHDVHVRDYAMGIHDDAHLQDALALWRSLLPLTPDGSIAPVATVLAAVAFECGDGALAQRAIDRAFDDRQGYPMASLLRQAMEAGWAPSAMTSMRKELRAAVVATVRAA